MKLLFICNNMHIGGVQRALVNLLNEISDKHEITLFLFYPEGELFDALPENIRIISGNRATRIMGMSQAEAKRSGFRDFARRTFYASLTKAFGTKLTFGILSRMQSLKKERFDAAISYMQNSAFRLFYGGCNEFAVNSVNAEKKISFVHCDFENYFGNNAYNRGYYKNFDSVACVSDSCREVFVRVCPEYADKTFTVSNCYNFEEMKKLGEAYEAERASDAVNIFTAARISEEKGIFRMLPVFAELKKKGIKFVWRVAGGGPLFESAVAECEKYGLTGSVKFLGMLENPYPYFKSSDLLLVPSYNEAAPMVFGEAAAFSLPVFTTETTSAKEMVEKTGLGFVCENNDEGIRESLERLLSEPSAIKANSAPCSNEKALNEFEKIIMRGK